MGSPYSHPMLPNFPEKDGIWSIKFSNECYQKYLGIQPRSFLSPECGWRSYVPRQVASTGYKNMIADFEAYSRSCDLNGSPLRPEIYEKEHTNEPAFYNFGFEYDLPGTEKAIHFPFNKISGMPEDALRIFLRTDRIAQYGVRFFMGMPGYTLEKYLQLIKKYSQQLTGEKKGALIVFADDAEYIGTNAWFRLKYQNKPDNVFEATPGSQQKLIDLITECNKLGSFTTFDSACSDLPALPDEINFDDDSAWHGARASTWAKTPMARLLRPWQELVRNKLENSDKLDDADVRKAWFHLTNSYNSDGQWPPTLPDAPHIIHPFNYSYCFDNLLKAEEIVGGVDRTKLKTDPIKTLTEILSMQQQLVAEKCEKLINSADQSEKNNAHKAKKLLAESRDITSLEKNDKVLLPQEYKIRADALVEARRLVGGIEIEKNV